MMGAEELWMMMRPLWPLVAVGLLAFVASCGGSEQEVAPAGEPLDDGCGPVGWVLRSHGRGHTERWAVRLSIPVASTTRVWIPLMRIEMATSVSCSTPPAPFSKRISASATSQVTP